MMFTRWGEVAPRNKAPGGHAAAKRAVDMQQSRGMGSGGARDEQMRRWAAPSPAATTWSEPRDVAFAPAERFVPCRNMNTDAVADVAGSRGATASRGGVHKNELPASRSRRGRGGTLHARSTSAKSTSVPAARREAPALALGPWPPLARSEGGRPRAMDGAQRGTRAGHARHDLSAPDCGSGPPEDGVQPGEKLLALRSHGSSPSPSPQSPPPNRSSPTPRPEKPSRPRRPAIARTARPGAGRGSSMPGTPWAPPRQRWAASFPAPVVRGAGALQNRRRWSRPRRGRPPRAG